MFDGITAGVEQGGIEVSKAFLKVVRANSKSPAVARPSAISHRSFWAIYSFTSLFSISPNLSWAWAGTVKATSASKMIYILFIGFA